ncbi:uncharacterized protein [Montipora foliosa]|uniref:uncharacterized protein isoform X1 n=2 Tax=Montipora foliosa TaxID=591990 RepID=UPI0035F1B448
MLTCVASNYSVPPIFAILSSTHKYYRLTFSCRTNRHLNKVPLLFFHLHFSIYLLIFGCFEPQLTCSVSLQEERNCSSATVSNHLSSLLYPIKFVNKEDAPDFKGVPIICQLRTQARILQKAGDLERPTTMEDLSAQNRWIPWEEVVSAVSKQREKFELTGPMKFKAKEFCDLIMLSLYVFIPRARGLEIRTLEVLSVLSGEQASNFDPKSSTGKNYLIVKDSGDIVLHFNNYKTRKFSGRDELALQPQDELCRLLLSYIKDYRPHMVTDSSGRYLLLVRL